MDEFELAMNSSAYEFNCKPKHTKFNAAKEKR